MGMWMGKRRSCRDVGGGVIGEVRTLFVYCLLFFFMELGGGWLMVLERLCSCECWAVGLS